MKNDLVVFNVSYLPRWMSRSLICSDIDTTSINLRTYIVTHNGPYKSNQWTSNKSWMNKGSLKLYWFSVFDVLYSQPIFQDQGARLTASGPWDSLDITTRALKCDLVATFFFHMRSSGLVLTREHIDILCQPANDLIVSSSAVIAVAFRVNLEIMNTNRKWRKWADREACLLKTGTTEKMNCHARANL